MKLKTCIIALVMASSTLSHGATTTANDRDAELMAALKIIASKDGGLTDEGDVSADYQLNAFLLAELGIVGGGAAATLHFLKPENVNAIAERLALDPKNITKLQNFVRRNAMIGGLSVGGLFMLNAILSHVMGLLDHDRLTALRSEAVKDPQVFRTQIRQFLKLTPTEQFLAAKKDEQFADHLIQMGRYLQAAELKGTRH